MDFTFNICSSCSFSSCSYFWILLSEQIATSVTTAVFSCLTTLCSVSWSAATCLSIPRTVGLLFSTIFGGVSPSHLVVPPSVCSARLHLISYYYVLPQPLCICGLGPVLVLSWAKPLCCPFRWLFPATDRISWYQPLLLSVSGHPWQFLFLFLRNDLSSAA